MSHVPLNEVVRRARAGDRAALEEVVRRCYEHVPSIARAALDHQARARGPVGTDDVVQSVLGVLLGKLAGGTFEVENTGHFGNWLKAVARNKARRAARGRTMPGGGDLPREEALGARDPADEGPDPAEWAELRDEVARAGERFTDREWRVIVLRDLEGLSWDEVASRAGDTTPDAARVMYDRALKRFRREGPEGSP